MLLLRTDRMPPPLTIPRILVLNGRRAEVLAQHRRRRVRGVEDVVLGGGAGARRWRRRCRAGSLVSASPRRLPSYTYLEPLNCTRGEDWISRGAEPDAASGRASGIAGRASLPSVSLSLPMSLEVMLRAAR